MINNDEFVSVDRMYFSLIEKNKAIDDENIFAIANQNENIRLKRQRVNIRLNNNIEITNVDDHSVFSFFFDCFSNAKNRIKKKRRFANSKQLVDTMKFVERFVD